MLSVNKVKISHQDQLICCLFKALSGGADATGSEEVKQELQRRAGMIKSEYCGKALYNELTVVCKTCSCDPHSIYCLDCFHEEQHKGHDYIFKLGYGMCDCGFDCSIYPQGFCPHHYGNLNMPLEELCQGVLDLKGVSDVIFFLFTAQITQFMLRNYESALLFTKIIDELLYSANFAVIKKVVTKYLFLTFSKLTDSKVLTTDIDYQTLQPQYISYDFVDTYQTTLANGKVNIDETVPCIMFFTLQQKELLQKNNSVILKNISDNILNILIQKQMGEKHYRNLLCYMFQVCCYLMDQQLKQIYQLDLKCTMYDIFYHSALTQICPHILIGPVENFVFSLQIYITLLNTITYKITYAKRIKHTPLIQQNQYVQNLLSSNIQQLKQYNNNNIDNFIKDLTTQINKLVCFISNQTIIEQPDLEYSIQWILRLSPECYSMTVQYYSFNIAYNPISCFLHLYLHYYFSYLLLRLKDINDITNQEQDHYYKYSNILSYINTFAWSMYVASLNSIDSYFSKDCQVTRINNIIQIDKKGKFTQQIMCQNIISSSLYLMLSRDIQKDCLIFSNKTYYKDIPIIQRPFYSVQNQTSKQLLSPHIASNLQTFLYNHQYQLANAYINYLYYILNSVEQQTQTSPHKFCIQQLEHVNQDLTYKNIKAQLTYRLVNIILSYQLMDAGYFAQHQQHIQYFTSLYRKTGHNFGDQYSMAIYLLQLMLVDAFDNNTVDQFLFQLFDNYGFVDTTQNVYVNYLQLCNNFQLIKVHNMMQQLVITLCYIALKKQGFKNQEDYIIKYLLKEFIVENDPTEYQMTEKIIDSPYIAIDDMWKLYEKYIISVQNKQEVLNDIYQPNSQHSYFRLSNDGLSACGLLDPFLTQFPEFLESFVKYAKLCNNENLLPGDIVNCGISMNNQLVEQIFTNKKVVQLVIDVIDLLLKEQNSSQQKNSDVMICILAFKQVVTYNIKQVEWTQKLKLMIANLLKYGEKSIIITLKEMIKCLFESFKEKSQDQINKVQSLKNKLSNVIKQTKKQQLLMVSDQMGMSQDQVNENKIDMNDPIINVLKNVNKDMKHCNICINPDAEMSLCVNTFIYWDGAYVNQQSPKVSEIQLFNILNDRSDKSEWTIKTAAQNLNNSINLMAFTCGHYVHQSCSIKASQNHCPICRCAMNIVLPYVQGSSIQTNSIQILIYKLISFLPIGLLNEQNYFAITSMLNSKQENSKLGHRIILLMICFTVSIVRGHQIRFSRDVESTEQQRNQMYQQLIAVCSGILVLIQEIKFLKTVVIPDNQLNLDTLFTVDLDSYTVDADEQFITLLQAIIVDHVAAAKKIEQAINMAGKKVSNVLYFVKDLCYIYGISLYNHSDQLNFIQSLESRIEQIQLSDDRHLLQDDISLEEIWFISVVQNKEAMVKNLKCAFNVLKITKGANDNAILHEQKQNLKNIVNNKQKQLNQYKIDFPATHIQLMKDLTQNKYIQCKCGTKINIILNQQVYQCLNCGIFKCGKCVINDLQNPLQEHLCTKCYYCPGKNVVIFLIPIIDKVQLQPGPFLDASGETDIELIRRRPLFLSSDLVRLLKRTANWTLQFKYQDFISKDRTIKIIETWDSKF